MLNIPKPSVIVPIPPCVPPAHTQIHPRCLTCNHFEMCGFKVDYFKTLSLMQDCLGSPADSFEQIDHAILIPGFIGLPVINEDEYLPKEITFDNSDVGGKLWLSKFDSLNRVNIIYMCGKYYILLKFEYNTTSELYELTFCKEAFYLVDYDLNQSSLEDLQIGLGEWREWASNAPAPIIPEKDVINTTHFMASLDCDSYEWNRTPLEDMIKKLQKKYPLGIPISGDGRLLYHIATYHVVDGEVPIQPYFQPEKVENYIPPCPPPPPPPPVRREDM